MFRGTCLSSSFGMPSGPGAFPVFRCIFPCILVLVCRLDSELPVRCTLPQAMSAILFSIAYMNYIGTSHTPPFMFSKLCQSSQILGWKFLYLRRLLRASQMNPKTKGILPCFLYGGAYKQHRKNLAGLPKYVMGLIP